MKAAQLWLSPVFRASFVGFVLFGSLHCADREPPSSSELDHSIADPADSIGDSTVEDVGDPTDAVAVDTRVASVSSPVFQVDGTTVLGLSLAGERMDSGRFKVRARTHGLRNVLGAAFRIHYDATRLALVDAQTHDLLSNDKAEGRYAITERKPGEIVYGGARFHEPTWGGGAALSGVDLDGGMLLTLEFEVTGDGDAVVAFAPLGRDLRNSALEPLQVDWIGGQISSQANDGGGLP